MTRRSFLSLLLLGATLFGPLSIRNVAAQQTSTKPPILETVENVFHQIGVRYRTYHDDPASVISVEIVHPLTNDQIALLANALDEQFAYLNRYDPEVSYVLGLNLSKFQFPDGQFEVLSRLPRLQSLNLSKTNVADFDLACLAGSQSLRHLDLQQTSIADAGILNLGSLPKLTSLNLSETLISKNGLKGMGEMPDLKNLSFNNTQIGPTGLKSLIKCPNLEHLDLGSTDFTDEGMESLVRLKMLRTLGLRHTRISDKSLESICKLPNLEILYLEGTSVTDSGVAFLAGLSRLKTLTFSEDTAVTEKGMDALKKLKELTIPYSLRLEHARSKKQRDWAYAQRTEFVQSPEYQTFVENGVHINYQDDFPERIVSHNTTADDDLILSLRVLPTIDRLSVLDLSKTSITDRALDILESLPNLRVLKLADTGVTGAGIAKIVVAGNIRTLVLDGISIDEKQLAVLRSLNHLQSLSLNNTGLTDAAIEFFGNLPQLEKLDLRSNPIQGKTLANLSSAKQLRYLDLSGTNIVSIDPTSFSNGPSLYGLDLNDTAFTDGGLRQLKGLAELRSLGLRNTKVSDSGLENIARFTNLRTLDLAYTDIADAALGHLAPLTEMRWLPLDGTKITNAGLEQLRGMSWLLGPTIKDTSISAEGGAILSKVLPQSWPVPIQAGEKQVELAPTAVFDSWRGTMPYVEFGPDNKKLAIAAFTPFETNGIEVHVFDLESRERSVLGEPLKLNSFKLLPVAFSPDGKWLASPATAGKVNVWDLTAKPIALKASFSFDAEGFATALVFSRDSTRLFVGMAAYEPKPSILSFELYKDAPAVSVDIMNPHGQEPTALCFSHDAKELAVGFSNNQGLIVELESKNARPIGDEQRDYEQRDFRDQLLPSFGIGAYPGSFSADDRFLYSFRRSSTNGLLIRDLRHRRVRAMLFCGSTAVSQDGSRMATILTRDSFKSQFHDPRLLSDTEKVMVAIWQVTDGFPSLIAQFDVGATSPVVALAPDGNTLATVESSATAIRAVKIWDLRGLFDPRVAK